jgi:hypothetical protein
MKFEADDETNFMSLRKKKSHKMNEKSFVPLFGGCPSLIAQIGLQIQIK